MINCKIAKQQNQQYIITSDLTHTESEQYTIISVSKQKFEDLKQSNDQSELVFLFDLHTGAV